MTQKFSVLMSLYYKEKPEYFQECIESVLNQTIKPKEIVIVFDGPIGDELRKTVYSYIKKQPSLYKVVPLKENCGLGLALRAGILRCHYELIARMDTDDINRKDRFELQLKEFEKDPELDICGCHMAEFEGTVDNIVTKRTVPLEDKAIKKYQRKRDGLNHATVMFKKSAVLRAGNYQSCLLMEDTLLWANMFMTGSKAMNIDDCLYYFRLSEDMFERRGGWSYFKKYRYGRKLIYKTGFISWWDYKSTVIVQFFVALMPNKLRGWLFKKMLHK